MANRAASDSDSQVMSGESQGQPSTSLDLAEPSAAESITWAARLRRRLFSIAPEETSAQRRGFIFQDLQRRRRAETIGSSFVDGYHAALLYADDATRLETALAAMALEQSGFAYEGAAMGLALLDHLTPWNRERFAQFARGAGNKHIYMLHVGAGWAMARLPGGLRMFNRLDPMLRWLAIDGYGFHEGYFHPRQSVAHRIVPHRFKGYFCRAFDQGLGRSLLFVCGADPVAIAKTVAEFPASRQRDLWAGVGLAAAYAGGLERDDLTLLRDCADVHAPDLAQGAAFAAKARQRAGNSAAHTELACNVFCGCSVLQAAQVTDDALAALDDCAENQRFEAWRARIRQGFEE